MGMFDTVTVRCLRCGEQNFLQSKAGECALLHYALHDAPVEIIADIDGDTFACTACETLQKIASVERTVVVRVAMVVPA